MVFPFMEMVIDGGRCSFPTPLPTPTQAASVMMESCWCGHADDTRHLALSVAHCSVLCALY